MKERTDFSWKHCLNLNHEYRQIEVKAKKNGDNFIAIDQFAMFRDDTCDFEPKEAFPNPSSTPSPPPSMSCKFQTGSCGWSWDKQLTDEKFYWNRTNGLLLTENGLEGPQQDQHDNNEGYFMYSNAKYSDKENSVATLTGPYVNGEKFGRNCMQFQFWFKPQNGLQSMSIYIEEEQGYRELIWQLIGVEIDQWMFGQFLLDHVFNYRLLVEVVKGNGDQGVVAFDDIISEADMIEECDTMPSEAVPKTTTETPPGAPLDCTFEQGPCGYSIEDAVDEFSFCWNRTTGTRLEEMSIQGPLTDHNANNNGTVFQI